MGLALSRHPELLYQSLHVPDPYNTISVLPFTERYMSVLVQYIRQSNNEADLHNNPRTPTRNCFVYPLWESSLKTLYTTLPSSFSLEAYQVAKSLGTTLTVLRESPDRVETFLSKRNLFSGLGLLKTSSIDRVYSELMR